MKEYKIVACDLDGTLLNNKSEISAENLRAIDALYARGVQFVPASGRSFSEMPEAIKNNPSIRYVIYSNGAVLLDKKTGQRFTTCLKNSDGRAILDVLRQYDCHIAYRQSGVCHVDAAQNSDALFVHHNVCEAHCDVVRNYAVSETEFEKVSYAADDIESIAAFFHRYEDKLACEQYFSQFSHLRVAEVCAHNVEIMHVDAGKHNALYALADLLGVDYAQTVAMGDSGNDMSMICAAGLGLAVENATDEIKQAADARICANEAHAVADVLEKYF